MVKSNSTKSVVYAFRNDRMGSRIIAILNAMRIAKDYDINFNVHWLVTDTVSEEIKDPSQIFAQSFIDTHFIPTPAYQNIETDLYEVAMRNPGWDGAKLKDHISKKKGFLVSHAFVNTTIFPDENLEDVRVGIADAFNRITFNPIVTKMMAKINAAFDQTPPIAYHIRRGDIIDPTSNAAKKIWPKKYTPREFYEVHLKRHSEQSSGKVIVFSDEPREVERLKAQSPNVLALEDMIDTDQLNPSQYDFLSLYAMSRCPQIIGPPGSQFSEIAALLGNSAVIDVQAALTKDDHSSALSLLVQHLDEGDHHFLGLADVGQCLPFALDYWIASQTTKGGAKIVQKYHDLGLQRAYVFVILCKLYLSHNDANAALKVREIARQQQGQFDIAMAELNLLCVQAHARLNDNDGAIQSLAFALWSFPNIQNGERVATRLVFEKRITPDNFFPFDPDLRRKAIPGSPAAGGVIPGGIKGRAPIEIPLIVLDIISRDWTLFLGTRRHRLFHDKDRIAMLFDRIKSLCIRETCVAGYESMCGLYCAELGDFKLAKEHHKRALEHAPQNPLYQKRYAEVLFETNQKNRAIKIMEAIVARGDQHILYTARLAEMLTKSKQVDTAIKHYRKILPFAHNYPEVILRGAMAMSRKKDSKSEACEYGRVALKNSQGSSRVLNAYATIMKRCGSRRELFVVLTMLTKLGALRPKFQELYDALEPEFNENGTN